YWQAPIPVSRPFSARKASARGRMSDGREAGKRKFTDAMVEPFRVAVIDCTRGALTLGRIVVPISPSDNASWRICTFTAGAPSQDSNTEAGGGKRKLKTSE